MKSFLATWLQRSGQECKAQRLVSTKTLIKGPNISLSENSVNEEELSEYVGLAVLQTSCERSRSDHSLIAIPWFQTKAVHLR